MAVIVEQIVMVLGLVLVVLVHSDDGERRDNREDTLIILLIS